MIQMFKDIIIVRGGGDIASGAIQKLHRSGFQVLVLEIEKPTSIRRTVCFSEAIYEQTVVIEEIKAVSAKNMNEVEKAWDAEAVPVIVDRAGKYIDTIKPKAVVDAIMAKKNLGTSIDMAPITIGLGPGFEAGKDVKVVIETMRGHNLGRLIFNGRAMEDTGTPGEIKGFSKERVIHSPGNGIINNIKEIGDIVRKEDILAYVGQEKVLATIDGVLRGIIRDKSSVREGLKIADIDPRLTERENYYTISDKARNIGGAVLEAILYLIMKQNN